MAKKVSARRARFLASKKKEGGEKSAAQRKAERKEDYANRVAKNKTRVYKDDK